MKKIILVILKSIWAVIGVVAVYCILSFLLPYIEVPAKPTTEPRKTGIYIKSNGVHTDLVVPVKTAIMDWTKVIPFENTVSKRTDFKYVGIGWGDKGFYLDTPTWADLKFSTAVKAAFWMSESAMHCTFYSEITEDQNCKRILLTDSQYADLIKYIEAKFDHDSNGQTILVQTDAVYGKDDAFYEAKGKYSFLNTCNTWTNNGLIAAGQKGALWTSTDRGIFQHYP
ncbi:TIGR02117 family protein [Kaistella palustris]|uniref:TIGR02117 family protein n=1 Tax=Kaistella palustris TaxID=493376 RepID=UPI00048121AD|nr:TIGR02117 family protein [Kaistella palustris]